MARKDRGPPKAARRPSRPEISHPLFLLIERYEWVHTTIGILGNAAFFAGSILFLYEGLRTSGTWLFILGSFGMLVGSVGSAVVRLVRRRSKAL